MIKAERRTLKSGPGRVTILIPRGDPAAQNIRENLLRLENFVEVHSGVYSSERAWLIEGLPGAVPLPQDTLEVIVASRHVGESGRPSLTVHVPGLPDKSELPPASPPTLRAALAELKKQAERLGLPHQVSLEATHHLPGSFPVPIAFVEIGSTEEEWSNRLAGEAAAMAILAALNPEPCRRAIGVGGPHYAPLHTRICLETGIGFGHILSKHAPADAGLIRLALERSGGEMIVLDWKGASRGQREACRELERETRVVRAGALLKKV